MNIIALKNGYLVACISCEHFDRDTHCALPSEQQLITGCIRQPMRVVCDRYVLRDGIEEDYQARRAAIRQAVPA